MTHQDPPDSTPSPQGPEAQGLNPYEQKQQRRRDRLEAAANRAHGCSEAAYKRSRELLAPIPLGQPILVGHHSERGHRATLRRSDGAMRKAIGERGRAEELERRAKAVGRGGISSDDPDAIDKLKAKLVKLRANREALKRLNALYRKAGSPNPDDPEAWQRYAALEPLPPDILERLRVAMSQSPWDRKPVESYQLTNLGANIRRIEQRITQLRAAPSGPETETASGAGYRVVECPDDNRLRIYFDDKPAAELRSRLKSFGFRWAPSEGAWQRQLNNAARAAAQGALS